MKKFGMFLLIFVISLAFEIVAQFFGAKDNLCGWIGGVVYTTLLYEFKLMKP